jgi:type I restriction enzyme S subunit
MELKEGFKKTEIGIIPNDWDAVAMGDVGQTIIGLTYSPNDVKDYGTLVLRSSNVQSGRLAFEDNVYVDMELPSRVIVENGDILICVRNGSKQLIGKCALIDHSAAGYAFGAFMSIYRSKLSKFIFFQFQSNQIQKQINEVMGATINQLTNKDLAVFKIALPRSAAEQTAIANALSDADALILSLQKLIVKKRQIKQGAMQTLLNPYENGVLKRGWTEHQLGDLFDFSGGYSASRDQLSTKGFCYLHYGDIHGSQKSFVNVEAEFNEIPKLEIPLNKVARRSLLNDGDIVFVDASEDDEGVSRHIVVVNPKGIPYISGLHTIVAKSKNNLLNNVFKRFCFQSAEVKEQFKFYAVGTKVSGISKTNIAKIELKMPSLDEQVEISETLSNMDVEITALETKLAKYQKIKQGMMQNLLTGRIRLV